MKGCVKRFFSARLYTAPTGIPYLRSSQKISERIIEIRILVARGK